MSAVEELRAMVDRITRFVGEHGDRWQESGTPEHLLVEAAKLMSGIASGLEQAEPMFELVRDGDRNP